MLLLHVRAQNAGIFIRRQPDDAVFEVFELSPPNRAVYSTAGRLRRSFPAFAVRIPLADLADRHFCAAFAQAVACMSAEPVDEMQSKIRKAGDVQSETRDTALPHLVTEYLVSVLRAIGTPVATVVTRKNTREEVMWKDAYHPWRRSPLWLLLRVGLQLGFAHAVDDVRNDAGADDAGAGSDGTSVRGMSSRSVKLHASSGAYKTFMTGLIARVLQLGLYQPDLEPEMVYVMTAKLSRRLLKLDVRWTNPWREGAHTALQSARDALHGRWETTRAACRFHPHLAKLRTIDPAADLSQPLPELDAVIAQCRDPTPSQARIAAEVHGVFLCFGPDEFPRIDRSLPAAADEKSAIHLERVAQLFAIEQWVELHLVSWLTPRMDDAQTCAIVQQLIRDYHRLAEALYRGNPEAVSRMVLTAMDLWVACDRAACHQLGLLAQYDHGIEVGLLTSLLLPLGSQLRRLAAIESHLRGRTDRADKTHVSVLGHFGHARSFAVRYFATSERHQRLLAEIEREAERRKDEKLVELERVNQHYRDLMRAYQDGACEFTWSSEYMDDGSVRRTQSHNGGCVRCAKHRQANALQIRIDEWPLPSNPDRAKATVFELRAPPALQAWRDATLFVLRSVLRCKYRDSRSVQTRYDLSSDALLQNWHRGQAQQLALRSRTKPNSATHRKAVKIPSTPASVCLANGRTYAYCDADMDAEVGPLVATDELDQQCTVVLPTSCAALQRFLQRPWHTPDGLPPNEAIAAVADCPDGMSLEEFRAFAVLPLGHRIQWQNILTQLAMPSLDWARPATTLLMTQLSRQAGPTDASGRRSGHELLEDERFGTRLLERLDDARGRVEQNWESFHAVATFVGLAARLLASTTSISVRPVCWTYLASCRALLLDWAAQLQTRAEECGDDTQRTIFAARAGEIALTCMGTFDLDHEDLAELLRSPAVTRDYLRCAMIIHEHLSSIDLARTPVAPLLLARWRRLSYVAAPMAVRTICQRGSSSLDSAILAVWAGYRPQGEWSAMDPPHQHWVQAWTSAPDNAAQDRVSMLVQFNTLTAELLVDGAPLAKLPSAYEDQPDYVALFGRAHLRVVPSDRPGFRFASRGEHAGHIVHFGPMGRAATFMAVDRAEHVFSLLPSRVFDGCLPRAFVADHVHWLDHGSGMVRLAPRSRPWSWTDSDWRLVSDGAAWRLIKPDRAVVALRSPSAQTIAHILSPLEDGPRIHTSVHLATGRVEVALPRLRLDFDLVRPDGCDAVLRSRQYPQMIVDDDQDIGTLHGLTTKLVLRDDHGSRRVLVPDGPTRHQRHHAHVQVSVARGMARVHAYAVDSALGRLVGSGTLQSMLVLCRLHALTSACLPDPLTGLTGTEQALALLSSAALRSFDQLDAPAAEVLRSMAALTPRRAFYPDHLREMQSVRWDPELSSLSQHGRFYLEVETFLAHTTRAGLMQPNFTPLDPLFRTERSLLARDATRSATFRVCGFGAEDHTVSHDRDYEARDLGQESSRARRTFTLARSIWRRAATVSDRTLLSLRGDLWGAFQALGRVDGPRVPLPRADMRYAGQILGSPGPYLAKTWCSAHVALPTLDRTDRYRMMIWLGTLAFAPSPPLLLVEVLAVMYCLPALTSISPPDHPTFPLTEGTRVSNVNRLVEVKPLHACPEANLGRFPGETKKAAVKRRTRVHRAKGEEVRAAFAQHVERQWPRRHPVEPDDPDTQRYISVTATMARIEEKWQVWWGNRQFCDYLTEIETELALAQFEAVDGHVDVPRHDVIESSPRPRFVRSEDVFRTPPPDPCPPPRSPLLQRQGPAGATGSVDEDDRAMGRLDQMLTSLTVRSTAEHEARYLEALRESLDCLRREARIGTTSGSAGLDDPSGSFPIYLRECREAARADYAALEQATRKVSPTLGAASLDLHGPRVTPRFFLAQLSRRRWPLLSAAWKSRLVGFATAIRTRQRAERLMLRRWDGSGFFDELVNVGGQGWDPMQRPDWLLLEVESGLIIREVQARIAAEMIDPHGGRNTVMQLNMGEGKSTVIVPIVATSVADGTALARVLVARAQSRQMFQMLLSKLGGLVDRRVYRLPISRSVRLSKAEAGQVQEICDECIRVGGVMLVQPEHVLSLQLMAIESCIAGRMALGRSLFRTLDLLHDRSRDVVDESDENFSVKFELIYTMGLQQPVELSPDRWEVAQRVLDLVGRLAPTVQMQAGERSLEIESRPGCFARVRVLRTEGGERLCAAIAEQICDAGLHGFSVCHQNRAMRRAVLAYISEPRPSEATVEAIEREPSTRNGCFWEMLLLMRGLLAGGVLAFCLRTKRWRVQYGLDLDRSPATKLAVPYRAKDCPSARSEFSHPDVVIVLTCLSYYYGGLHDDDLWIAFRLLVRADQPDVEYSSWTADAPHLPDAYRHLAGINLEDRVRCATEVFPPLRFSKGAIDFFLSRYVFPRHLREFPRKISASGWDLGRVKAQPITGFSGTADSRHLLPLDVHHLDLEQQRHTNALVLARILRSENQVHRLGSSRASTPSTGARSEADQLLRSVMAMAPAVRVILDVGAQVLDLDNRGMAERWLDMGEDDATIEAAVFFDEQDELSVIDRAGLIEPLQTSPFADRLEACVVFLDEAHTRGTDLRLPADYRAAVTLGPQLTKDRLVQGKWSVDDGPDVRC